MESKFDKRTIFGLIIGTVLGIVIMTALMRSCSHSVFKFSENVTYSDKDLQQAAQYADKACPQKVDDNTILEHCKFADKSFVYQYQLTGITVNSLDANVVRQSISESIPTKTDDNFKALVKQLIKKNYSLKYEYRDSLSETMAVTFNSNELDSILKK